MKGWMAALDAACAKVDPGLVLAAAAMALPDLAVAAHETVQRRRCGILISTGGAP